MGAPFSRNTQFWWFRAITKQIVVFSLGPSLSQTTFGVRWSFTSPEGRRRDLGLDLARLLEMKAGPSSSPLVRAAGLMHVNTDAIYQRCVQSKQHIYHQKQKT